MNCAYLRVNGPKSEDISYAKQYTASLSFGNRFCNHRLVTDPPQCFDLKAGESVMAYYMSIGFVYDPVGLHSNLYKFLYN